MYNTWIVVIKSCWQSSSLSEMRGDLVLQRCARVAEALEVGIMWVNCSQPCFCQAPWGGNKVTPLLHHCVFSYFFACKLLVPRHRLHHAKCPADFAGDNSDTT